MQQSDLTKFFQTYLPEAKLTKPAHIVGDNEDYNPGVEAMLDSEYLMAMGMDVPTTLYFTPGTKQAHFGCRVHAYVAFAGPHGELLHCFHFLLIACCG